MGFGEWGLLAASSRACARVRVRIIAAIVPALALGACALVAAGCGGAAAGKGSDHVVTYTVGRDPTGLTPKLVAECNKAAGGRYRIETIVMPPSADAVREQIIRRMAGKDGGLDILTLDVVWTAEFSEAGWLYDISKRMEPISTQFAPAALSTVRYDDKYWAMPVSAQVAMLFYRKDLVPSPPET